MAAGFSGKTAHSQEIPANLQAAIFYKVLSYDGSISSKQGDKITIFIVSDSRTQAKKDKILAGFKMLVGKKIGGKKVNLKTIGIADVAGVAPGNSILYFSAESEEATIKKGLLVAGQKKIATLGGSEELAKKGVAVGLKIGAQGKPEIVINLNASKKQGMKLSSRVLGLATVVK